MNLRTITTPSGTASAIIVSGLASKPHASATATVISHACFPDSSQSTVAHAATSHITVVVLSDRYDVAHINVTGAVVHNSHVRSAVHTCDSRRASQNVS